MQHQPYRLKKRLGQHFLKDEAICQKIIDALPKSAGSSLLEVGPGGGALTKYLLDDDFWDYKAIEFDQEKVDYLKQHYPKIENRMSQGDFLKMPLPFDQDFLIIGNFPYNISGPILFKVLDWEERLPYVVGMFQKEVAQRVCAEPGGKEYGLLSVLLQCYFKLEYLFDVPPQLFDPPPKVMSGVIRLTRLGNPNNIRNKVKFIALVKRAFAQRRKMLRNNLKGFFPEGELSPEYQQKRAEQLGVSDFVKIYKTHFESDEPA